jgi:hypothetical protein
MPKLLLKQVDDISEHARELFGIFAGLAGAANWDWKPLAVKAMEAAEVFASAVAERYAPQAAVPTPDANAAPPPDTPQAPPATPPSSTTTVAAPDEVPVPPSPVSSVPPDPTVTAEQYARREKAGALPRPA